MIFFSYYLSVSGGESYSPLHSSDTGDCCSIDGETIRELPGLTGGGPGQTDNETRSNGKPNTFSFDMKNA